MTTRIVEFWNFSPGAIPLIRGRGARILKLGQNTFLLGQQWDIGNHAFHDKLYAYGDERKGPGTCTDLWDDGHSHIVVQNYGEAQPQLLIDVSGHSGIIEIIVAYTTHGDYTANFYGGN
jgi:hypothetical protein